MHSHQWSLHMKSSSPPKRWVHSSLHEYAVSKSTHQITWTKLISNHAKSGHGTEALRIYHQMREEGVIPNGYTFLAALKACTTISALEAGRRIHSHVLESGHLTDMFVASSLVDMYAKCGSIDDACRAFENTKHPNLVTWNAMITGYAHVGMGNSALQFYSRMLDEGPTPNSRTFVAALKACSSLGAQEKDNGIDGAIKYLQQGKAIHIELAKRGLETDVFVGSALVNMYAKCGNIEDAHLIFDKIKHVDAVSWTAMILGYAHMQMGDRALELYACMQHEGFKPVAQTFVAALKACCSLASQEDKGVGTKNMKRSSLEQGRAIHAELAEKGFESNIFISNTLIDMYSRCGSIEDACQVFEKMTHPDALSWTAMIMGYSQVQLGNLALDFFARMQQEGFTPVARTYVAALKACSSLAAHEDKGFHSEVLKTTYLEQGRYIHAELAKRGFESDIVVATTLVDMYAKCGSMEDACRVFRKMTNRNVVTWTAMIMGYAQIQMGDLALQLYSCMHFEGFRPDAHTFVAVLKTYTSLAAQAEDKGIDGELMKARYLEQGRAIHIQIAEKGFESHIFVASALVHMYAKCGSVDDARQVFEKMSYQDVVSFTTMILAYAQMQMGDSALELYVHMQNEGFIPDTFTFVALLKACGSLSSQQDNKRTNGELVKTQSLKQAKVVHSELAKRDLESDIFVASMLVDTYAKCGSIEDARRIFENMRYHNVVSWTAMITGYMQMEMADLALDLYVSMQQEGFIPDAHAFVSAMKACSFLASLERGKKIHSQICRMGLEGQLFLASCLIDMYGKCGSMADAQNFFDSLVVRDSVIWNSLIAGYSSQGNSECTFDLYKRMQQEDIQPNSATLISVLSVCSHKGLVEQGQICFHSMWLKFGISPSSKHYRCMTDLLGRAGHIDEAVAVVKKMPFKFDAETWITLLSACRKWNNIEIARSAFEGMVMLDRNFFTTYKLMADIYISAQMWDEGARIQKMRKKQRA